MSILNLGIAENGSLKPLRDDEDIDRDYDIYGNTKLLSE
jgi:hypothetical protein